jgi:hypothetical protein
MQQDFIINRQSSIFRPPPSVLYICRETSANQLFYAKQTQFPKSQMNIYPYITKDYENKHNWTLGQNKPNQTQFQRQKKSRYLVVSFLQQECKIETIFERISYILQI